MLKKAGKVYLVGAGPGDRELISLKGARLVQAADCIVYDALVNPDILDKASPEAEAIFVGKKPHSHTISQESLNQLLISKALEGKQVIRLKGGDPFVLAAEEKKRSLFVSKKFLLKSCPGSVR